MSKRVPKYRKQSRSNGNHLAFVELGNKRHYLGEFGSDESREMYARLLAEWTSSKQQARIDSKKITIGELVDRFLSYADDYYRNPNIDTCGSQERYPGEIRGYRRAFAPAFDTTRVARTRA